MRKRKFPLKGADTMKKRSPVIQQGIVTELMSQLANLPERAKAPEDPVCLSEIFCTKEYMAEVKTALKKGYTFEDLAEIFTERCGVAVSARQIKYHFTRGQKRSSKSKSGREKGGKGTSKDDVSSMDSTQKSADNNGAENKNMTDSSAKYSLESEEFIPGNGVATGTATNANLNANPGAFSFR
jgi:hypothetical protein